MSGNADHRRDHSVRNVLDWSFLLPRLEPQVGYSFRRNGDIQAYLRRFVRDDNFRAASPAKVTLVWVIEHPLMENTAASRQFTRPEGFRSLEDILINRLNGFNAHAPQDIHSSLLDANRVDKVAWRYFVFTESRHGDVRAAKKDFEFLSGLFVFAQELTAVCVP